MTRLASTITATPSLRVGLGGNHYVVCLFREPLLAIAGFLGRSARSVYFRPEYQCWAIRVKRETDKDKLRRALGRGQG